MTEVLLRSQNLTNQKSWNSKTIAVLAALMLAFSFFTFSQDSPDPARVAAGKALFKANCAACHNPLQNATGPALKGVLKTWQDAGDYQGKTGEQWLHEWVRNWNTPVKAGYPLAVEMANWSPSQMSLFPALKDDEISDIFLYCDNSQAQPAAAAADAASDGAGGGAKVEAPKYAIYVFIAFLLALVVILVSVSKKLERVVAERKEETVPESTPFLKSRKFTALLILLVTVFVCYNLVDGAIHLGRQQGYQPTQPIRFSHELHAGKHKIECQYCHTTAADGKHSNIPTINTCMNCHKNVQNGPEYGKTEIAKIYAAAGWDPAKGDYVNEPKPVEWVRIHNLPDHVYFNHSQHVTVGKIPCQSCHGPVEEMKEVYQFAPLSMGWCINCHRQTEVQFASNDYYSTYEKIHEDLKKGKLKKVTVETIGGTECQKCHY